MGFLVWVAELGNKEGKCSFGESEEDGSVVGSVDGVCHGLA